MAPRYKLTSVRISPFCELARWVFERHGIDYTESCHAPIWNVPYTRAAGQTLNVPVVRAPDATFQIREFLNYIDARARASEKLFPSDPAARKDAEALVDTILKQLAVTVRLYAYSNMLPNPITGPMMADRAPWLERKMIKLFYPIQARAMTKVLLIDPASTEVARKQILASFDDLSKRLPPSASGTSYFYGDQPTIADFAFAAGTAPITLPPEYDAPFPTFAQTPPGMQTTILAVQATPAAQMALRLYREQRTSKYKAADTSPSTGLRWGDRVSRWFQRILSNPFVLRAAARVLRLKPAVKIGGITVVSRYDEVVKVLNADTQYTIAEINGPPMKRIAGGFVLGMDRGPDYDRESAAIRSVLKPTDIEWVRLIAAETAQSLVDAAQPYKRLDVVSLARLSAARVVGNYFGVPGPTEHILMQWMRSLFLDIFLNQKNAPHVRRAADNSARELRDYLDALIYQRTLEGAPGDDILSRLIRAGQLDPDGVRRNITGIIVGAIDTTSTATANSVGVLLRKPYALEETWKAAQLAEIAPLRQCVYEALRFNPQAGLLARHSKADGSTVFALTIGAMFDPKAFPQPGSFLSNRPIERYLHFGHGMHTCYGAMINGAQLPELVRAVVNLPNVRRAAPPYRTTLYEGPFPDRLIVQFGG